MKLPISRKTDESNVAVTLVKSGRPWMGYSLVVVCHVLWCITAICLAVAASHGLR